MLGRPLLKGEVVHHRDNNKRNNDPANLKVITQAEHMREHGLAIPGVQPAHKPWTKRWPKHSNSDQQSEKR
jgi:HNH endonuclease